MPTEVAGEQAADTVDSLRQRLASMTLAWRAARAELARQQLAVGEARVVTRLVTINERRRGARWRAAAFAAGLGFLGGTVAGLLLSGLLG